MAQNHTTPFTPPLPPEIWRLVLHSFGKRDQDTVELWTACRGVCRHFKYEVEEFFIANYLLHTSLFFDVTTSQGFKRDWTIKSYNHEIPTKYSRISLDRAGAIFEAKDKTEVQLLQCLHNRGVLSTPSHLLDFGRPSDNAALPGVFFHANGDVEIGWRELFAAVLAEEKYNYQTKWNPVSFNLVGIFFKKH